jgi:hypothetical protein
MTGLEQAVQILALANTLEPTVFKYILALMEKGQGKTLEQLLGEADSIWAQMKANADKELNSTVSE